MDFWHESHEGVHVLVSPEELEHVERHLVNRGMLYQMLNDHIHRHVTTMYAHYHSNLPNTVMTALRLRVRLSHTCF